VTEFLLATAGVILFTVAVGLVRILGGPGGWLCEPVSPRLAGELASLYPSNARP
jgi:hypothetical protein